MKEQNTELTEQEIAEKIEALKSNMSKKIEDNKKPKESKKLIFLRQISSVIKEKYNEGISYKDMSKSIYEIFNIKVNEQTIRAFAHAELGIPKRSKGRAKGANKVATDSSTEPVKDKVFIEEVTTAAVADTTKKLSVKEQRRANAEKAKEEKI